MPTPTTSTPDNAESLSSILKRVEELEAKLFEARSAKTEAQSAKSSSKWAWLWGSIVALVLAGVAAVGVWFFKRKLKKKNQELAELRTTLELEKLRKTAVEHELKVETEREAVHQLEEELRELDKNIKVHEVQTRLQQNVYDEAKKRIEQAQSWEDMERLNEEGR